MVTKRERKLIVWLIKLKAFVEYYHFRVVCVSARYGFKWLLNIIRARQIVDELHHAPACPANHWHKKRLVFSRCTCGAGL